MADKKISELEQITTYDATTFLPVSTWDGYSFVNKKIAVTDVSSIDNVIIDSLTATSISGTTITGVDVIASDVQANELTVLNTIYSQNNINAGVQVYAPLVKGLTVSGTTISSPNYIGTFKGTVDSASVKGLGISGSTITADLVTVTDLVSTFLSTETATIDNLNGTTSITSPSITGTTIHSTSLDNSTMINTSNIIANSGVESPFISGTTVNGINMNVVNNINTKDLHVSDGLYSDTIESNNISGTSINGDIISGTDIYGTNFNVENVITTTLNATESITSPSITGTTIHSTNLVNSTMINTANIIASAGVESNFISGATITSPSIKGALISGTTITSPSITGASISGTTMSTPYLSAGSIYANFISGATIAQAGTLAYTSLSGNTVSGINGNFNNLTGNTIYSPAYTGNFLGTVSSPSISGTSLNVKTLTVLTGTTTNSYLENLNFDNYNSKFKISKANTELGTSSHLLAIDANFGSGSLANKRVASFAQSGSTFNNVYCTGLTVSGLGGITTSFIQEGVNSNVYVYPLYSNYFQDAVYFGDGYSGNGSKINDGSISGQTITGGINLNTPGDVRYGGSLVHTSDRNLKTNIVDINNSLDIIDSLRPVTFNWNDTAKLDNKNLTDNIEYGLIAQDVQTILPTFVSQYDDKYLGIDYTKFIPLLIDSIKELKAEIDILKVKIG